MGSRSEDEKIVREKDQEDAMGSRGEDEKEDDAPADTPQGQGQPSENVRRNPHRSVRQRSVPRYHAKWYEEAEERSRSSKFSGVQRKGNGKWGAEIHDKDGDRHWLGTYSTEEEAALAYDKGAIEYGRSDVKLNFPKRSEGDIRSAVSLLAEMPKFCGKKARSKRRRAKQGPAVGHAREGGRERKTSSSAYLQEKLIQFMEPFLMMLTMLVDDLVKKGPCAILIKLVKVFIRCFERISSLVHFYEKSRWEPALLAVTCAEAYLTEFAKYVCWIIRKGLKELGSKKDPNRASNEKPLADPGPSTSTAVVSEEQLSDAESSIEMKAKAIREGKMWISYRLQEKNTQVSEPRRNMQRKVVDDPMQGSAVAILHKLVETFINCISHAQSLAQQLVMAQREPGLEAINSKESWHKFAVELSSIMLQLLGELYPSLQQTSQGNSINQPPVVIHQSFIQRHTNDVNMGSITRDLVAHQEEEDNVEIGAIVGLLLIITSQEGENKSKIEE